MAEQFDRFAVFKQARDRAKKAQKSAMQEQSQALKRRFASLGRGGLQSGAAIVAEQKLQKQGAEQLGNVMSEIDAAEQAEKGRLQDIADARKFQTQERLGSQQFATGEREATQLFNKQLFDEDMAFKKNVNAQQYRLAKYDQQLKEQGLSLEAAKFREEQAANAFNKLIASKEADLADLSERELFNLSQLMNQLAGRPSVPRQHTPFDKVVPNYRPR